MTNKARILFVIDRFVNPYAGTESQLFQLIKNLPRDQFEPELLVFQPSDFIDSGEMPCPVHVLGRHRIADPRTWFSLFLFAREKRSAGFQIAHIFFNDASIIGPPVFRACGIQPIISRRDMGYWYTRDYLLALRQTGRFVSHVVVNSNAVREVTCQEERIPFSRISVIYNGYEDQSIQGDAEIAELEAIKKNTTAPLTVLVANLRPIKRIGDAIKAIGILKRKGVALELVIIGDGDPGDLQVLAENERVARHIHFLGARSDVRDCLDYMDIGVLCSESEGYSNTIVEYMNQGLPVVASRVGGNPEAVEHERTGFLYPVGEIEQLAAYLGLLAGGLAMRSDLGESGRQLAKQRHALATMIDAHVDLYHRLVDSTESENRVAS